MRSERVVSFQNLSGGKRRTYPAGLNSTMEAYAKAHAMPVNQDLKERIFAGMDFENLEFGKFWSRKSSVFGQSFIAAAEARECLHWGWFYQTNNTMKQQMAIVKDENQKMADETSKDQKLIALFKETKMIKLKGVEKSPESLAMVFYDEKNASEV